MSLREYLELTDVEFRAVFKNSPIKRIKRRGFLRNVCVALGNAGDVSDIPALEHAVAHEEPLIAEHAEWAIHQIRSRQGTSLRHSEQRLASCT
jgi:epoxyqueuosine reductase